MQSPVVSCRRSYRDVYIEVLEMLFIMPMKGTAGTSLPSTTVSAACLVWRAPLQPALTRLLHPHAGVTATFGEKFSRSGKLKCDKVKSVFRVRDLQVLEGGGTASSGAGVLG
ncbi:hypothetical protein E2C01_003903 [Portunus trituberculatus]|uniref:Uncharacterized protein n=1 Tax=Portunus trituberculatus TaxID=210409 RepID=A0A5B7CR01_PORTR|nr:hypothetical protein [Portunus trituberculatus]